MLRIAYQDVLSQLFTDGTQSTPSAHPTTKLSRPIVIPATKSDVGAPFVRGYASELSQLPNPIDREAFLTFISHLNAVIAPSVSLEILGYTGDIVGLVPEPTAQLVGTIVGEASQAAREALSELRTDICLTKINAEIFAPRGLRARVVRLAEVAEVVGMPILTEKKDPKGVAKVDKNVTILPPYEGPTDAASTQARRLAALQPWTLPLEVEDQDAAVGELSKPKKMLARVDKFERDFNEKRAVKKRGEMLAKYEEKKRSAEEKHRKELESLAAEEEAAREHAEKARTAAAKPAQEKLDKLATKKEKAAKEHEKKLAELEREKSKHPGQDEKYDKKKQKKDEEYQQHVQSLEKEESRAQVLANEGEAVAKIMKKREKAIEEYEKKMLKIEAEHQREDREEKEMRKLKFLLITNLEEGDARVTTAEAMRSKLPPWATTSMATR